MKQCPKCNHIYDDDNINFCLYDGTTLLTSSDSEATIEIPKPLPGTPAHPQGLSNGSQDNPVEPNHKFNLIYLVILVLAVLLAGTGVALFYERGKDVSIANIKQAELNNVDSGVPKPEQSPKSSTLPTVSPNISASRYSVNTCNSIKDSRTGLEWYVGPDQNSTWDEAHQWVRALNSCDGVWRMPSIEEIKTLYDPGAKAGTGYFTSGKYFPAHIDPVFNGIGGGSWVWSNEKIGNDARSFNLNQGKTVTYSADNTQYSTRAFAVRRAEN